MSDVPIFFDKGFADAQLTAAIQKSKKSVLLLGPRQTGKSTLIHSTKPDLAINLARESEFLAFASRPDELDERLAAMNPKTVFIDEVQPCRRCSTPCRRS